MGQRRAPQTRGTRIAGPAYCSTHHRISHRKDALRDPVCCHRPDRCKGVQFVRCDRPCWPPEPGVSDGTECYVSVITGPAMHVNKKAKHVLVSAHNAVLDWITESDKDPLTVGLHARRTQTESRHKINADNSHPLGLNGDKGGFSLGHHSVDVTDGRGSSNAPDHRLSGHRHSVCQVYTILIDWHPAGKYVLAHDVLQRTTTGEADRPTVFLQPDLVDRHGNRVAGCRALDKNRSCHRVNRSLEFGQAVVLVQFRVHRIACLEAKALPCTRADANRGGDLRAKTRPTVAFVEKKVTAVCRAHAAACSSVVPVGVCFPSRVASRPDHR